MLFAPVGGAIGWGLGTFVPGYYLALYGGYGGRGPHDDPDFPRPRSTPWTWGSGWA